MGLFKTLGTVAKGLFKKPSSTINKLVKDGGGVLGAAQNILSAGNVAKTVVGLAGGAAAAPSVIGLGGSLIKKLSSSNLGSSFIGQSLLKSAQSTFSPSNITSKLQSSIASVVGKPSIPQFSDPLTGLQKTVFNPAPVNTAIGLGAESFTASRGLNDFNVSSGDLSVSKGSKVPAWLMPVGFGLGIITFLIAIFKR